MSLRLDGTPVQRPRNGQKTHCTPTVAKRNQSVRDARAALVPSATPHTLAKSCISDRVHAPESDHQHSRMPDLACEPKMCTWSARLGWAGHGHNPTKTDCTAHNCPPTQLGSTGPTCLYMKDPARAEEQRRTSGWRPCSPVTPADTASGAVLEQQVARKTRASEARLVKRACNVLGKRWGSHGMGGSARWPATKAHWSPGAGTPRTQASHVHAPERKGQRGQQQRTMQTHSKRGKERAPAGAHIQMTGCWMLRGRMLSSRLVAYRQGPTAALHRRSR